MELKFYGVNFLVKGVFPQVETIDIFQRRVGPWDFLNSKELKSFCYNVKLKYQAKLKDVLGYYGHNGWGAMVSKRLRDILDEYNLRDDFNKYRYGRVKEFLDEIILNNSHKIDIIDDLD
jgi:hypothetical protein